MDGQEVRLYAKFHLKGSIRFVSLHHIVHHHPLVVSFDIFIHYLHMKQWALARANAMMDAISRMMLNQHPKMLHNKYISIVRVFIILTSNSRSSFGLYPNETLKRYNSCMRNSIKTRFGSLKCSLGSHKAKCTSRWCQHANSIE